MVFTIQFLQHCSISEICQNEMQRGNQVLALRSPCPHSQLHKLLTAAALARSSTSTCAVSATASSVLIRRFSAHIQHHTELPASVVQSIFPGTDDSFCHPLAIKLQLYSLNSIFPISPLVTLQVCDFAENIQSVTVQMPVGSSGTKGLGSRFVLELIPALP